MNKFLYFLIFFFLFAVTNNLKAEDNKIMSFEEIEKSQGYKPTDVQWDLFYYLQNRCIDPGNTDEQLENIDCRLNASKKLYDSFNSVPNKEFLWMYRLAENEFAYSLINQKDRTSFEKGMKIFKKIYDEPDAITDKLDRINADLFLDEAYAGRYARKNTARVNLAWSYYINR